MRGFLALIQYVFLRIAFSVIKLASYINLLLLLSIAVAFILWDRWVALFVLLAGLYVASIFTKNK
jgi:hypothetical protein